MHNLTKILRMSVEKCILCEELKILNLNRDLTTRDRLRREEEILNNKANNANQVFRQSKVHYQLRNLNFFIVTVDFQLLVDNRFLQN